MKQFSTFLLPVVLMFSPAVANSSGDEVAQLRKNLSQRVPASIISQVRESPVDGLFEVIVGSEIYYMNVDARYVINGDLTDLATRRNITEEARAGNRKAKIEAFGEENMLVYKPEDVEHTITVVTDIDCPYCRRLHKEMDEYMENNIKVRYIFMPLKGQSDYETTVSVWCSDNRNAALDTAKAGGEIEKTECENPIHEHLALARGLGVRGTPAIIMENGDMVPGYVPANKLIEELGRIDSVAAE